MLTMWLDVSYRKYHVIDLNFKAQLCKMHQDYKFSEDYKLSESLSAQYKCNHFH